MGVTHQVAAQKSNWVPLAGHDLREFMSDLTVERIDSDGRISRAVYAADGTGALFNWGVKFARICEL